MNEVIQPNKNQEAKPRRSSTFFRVFALLSVLSANDAGARTVPESKSIPPEIQRPEHDRMFQNELEKRQDAADREFSAFFTWFLSPEGAKNYPELQEYERLRRELTPEINDAYTEATTDYIASRIKDGESAVREVGNHVVFRKEILQHEALMSQEHIAEYSVHIDRLIDILSSTAREWLRTQNKLTK